MRQNVNKTIKRSGRVAGLVLALLLLGTQVAWAGQWEEQETGGRKYQEDGAYLTDWQQIDGVWYYFSSETGLYVEKPSLTSAVAVAHLLENAVNRSGWYKNETYPIHYNIDNVTGYKMTVSVWEETAPDSVTSTLGVFDVNLRNGQAKEQSTKNILDLYGGQ